MQHDFAGPRIVVQDQLQLIKLRNRSEAFYGDLEIRQTDEHHLGLTWRNGGWLAALEANLLDFAFTVTHVDQAGTETTHAYS